MFGMHYILFPDKNATITWFLFQLLIDRQTNDRDETNIQSKQILTKALVAENLNSGFFQK